MKQDTLQLSGSKLTGKLLDLDSGVEFDTTFTAYNGFIRLFVDEPPPNQRFQVPEVLNPNLDVLESQWTVESQEDNLVVFQAGPAKLRLRFRPFAFQVESGDEIAAVFNYWERLNIEYRREKQVCVILHNYPHPPHAGLYPLQLSV